MKTAIRQTGIIIALFFLAALASAQTLDFPADFGAGELKNGLDKFRGTKEGKAEEGELAELEIKIKIETYKSDKNYGECEVTGTDAKGNPTEITIRIDKSAPGDSDEIADTIKHELRHAEIFIANGADEEDKHDGLHDGTDKRLNDFNKELGN